MIRAMPKLSSSAWRAISPYLDRALDMEDHDRGPWLESLRTENPSIASPLETLLDEHRALRADGFLDHSPEPPPHSALAGQSVGAYTLVSPIGEGGMGAVWLAERSDGRFERKVALKFLAIALAGRGGEERFKREGTILARLVHAHIAQLLDAGVSSGGQPYLVLELVDGEHIDRYCHERKLDVDVRIRLFLQVLAAVAHAHSNLIVHRDLKPSNVLVNTEGQVKLLDFGIGKFLEDEGQPGAASKLTRDVGSAMTLLYAAPEQMTGGAVTTATDVYALGVMLYLLLTGQHPAGSGPHSPAELIKSIVETEPSRPSNVAPDKLRRRLGGDLDTILIKALKKNPQERYVSVFEFAADLRRHLNHEPIGARADSLRYRGVKFVRRHRTAIALASLAVMATVVGVVSTAIQARTATRERLVAERRFNQVRQLAGRVLALDGQIQGLPGSTKARHEIVAMSKDYLEALAGETQADPDLAFEIATAFWTLARAQGVPATANLGQYAQAEESLREAEAILDPVLDAAPNNLKALLVSARISADRMIVASSVGRRDEWSAHARKAAQRLETLLGLGEASLSEGEITTAVSVLNNIAQAHKNAHDFEGAIRYGRRAVEIASVRPFASSYAATGSSIVADSMRLSGDLDGALETIREARRGLEGSHIGDEHRRQTSLQAVLWREGLILGEYGEINLGRPADAIDPLQKAFDVIEDLARTDPNDASGRMLFIPGGGALGNVLRDRDSARALAVYDRSLLRVGEVKNNIKARRGEAELLAYSSYALRRLNRTADAHDRIERAFQLLRDTKDYPAEQIALGSEADVALRALADHHAGIGDARRAAEIYQDLLDRIRVSKPDPEHDLRHATHISRLYESSAAAHRRSGKPEEAKALSTLRLELWRGWQSKLPRNPFVRQQLVAAQP
jgi:serine/threonine-protein kinase